MPSDDYTYLHKEQSVITAGSLPDYNTSSTHDQGDVTTPNPTDKIAVLPGETAVNIPQMLTFVYNGGAGVTVYIQEPF